MITKTRGIVFNYIKHKESSIIVKIYTEEHGMQSYVINSIRSPASKKSIANFQPFTLLEIVGYWSSAKDIQRLSDSKIAYPTSSFKDIKKSAILIFLSEVLTKLLYHETGENRQMFKFIWDSVIAFDQLDTNYENFHLSFLIRLTSFLGFDISTNDRLKDLCQGDQAIAVFLTTLDLENYFNRTPSNGEIRYKALKLLLREYRDHFSHIDQIKSLKVLKEVFY